MLDSRLGKKLWMEKVGKRIADHLYHIQVKNYVSRLYWTAGVCVELVMGKQPSQFLPIVKGHIKIRIRRSGVVFSILERDRCSSTSVAWAECIQALSRQRC